MCKKMDWIYDFQQKVPIIIKHYFNMFLLT